MQVCDGRDGDTVTNNPTLMGSAAEFYIEPAMRCVGNMDLIRDFKDVIALQYDSVREYVKRGVFFKLYCT